VVPSKRDTTATGPMAISLELPMKAYTRGHTKLVSAIVKESQVMKLKN